MKSKYKTFEFWVKLIILIVLSIDLFKTSYKIVKTIKEMNRIGVEEEEA